MKSILQHLTAKQKTLLTKLSVKNVSCTGLELPILANKVLSRPQYLQGYRLLIAPKVSGISGDHVNWINPVITLTKHSQ